MTGPGHLLDGFERHRVEVPGATINLGCGAAAVRPGYIWPWDFGHELELAEALPARKRERVSVHEAATSSSTLSQPASRRSKAS